MKKILIVSIGLLMVSNLFAQKIAPDNVPADVRSTFKNKYSSAEKVSWQLDYDNYVAEFTFLNSKMSSMFDKEGNWLETHYFIKSTELPKEVKDSVTKQFGTLLSMYTIEDAEKIESKDKDLYYKLEVEKAGTTYNMMYSENGKTLKKEIAKKDEDDKKKEKKAKEAKDKK